MKEEEISIPIGKEEISGTLVMGKGVKGLVIFVHGSGSSRHSIRNRYVAEVLQKGGFATLLFDLLTPGEERIDEATAELRFNIPMLADRTLEVLEWAKEKLKLKAGLFGASTGAAAALIAAAKRGKEVHAVVSRGGRPDLALSYLPKVKAPTLLIVGGLDGPVIEMNREAYEKLQGEKKMEIIEGATHLFEEQGKLEEVARLALIWFEDHL